MSSCSKKSVFMGARHPLQYFEPGFPVYLKDARDTTQREVSSFQNSVVLTNNCTAIIYKKGNTMFCKKWNVVSAELLIKRYVCARL